MLNKIGVQTFTIRKLINTPEKLYDVLLDLSKTGIKTFELARIKFSKEELIVLRKLKKEENISFSVCQIKLKLIEKNLDWYIGFCKALDIKHIEVSVIPIKSFLRKEKGMTELSDRLNDLGKKLKSKNINLLYHHHHYELVKMGDLLGLEHLINNTDPKYLNFVVDTYWLARGGYNPARFIDIHNERIKGVHLRDYSLNFSKTSFSINDVAIGDGTIDFEEIVSKDKSWNIDFYSIEQATDKPLEELNKSYKYLKKLI